ncbi:hypothetical protein ACVMB0_002614 [Bradyrhizobium sp. USDA 4451]
MLPLDLSIEDYSTNEKVAYLPRELTQDGSGPFANEAPGDLCYDAPWAIWPASTAAIAIPAGSSGSAVLTMVRRLCARAAALPCASRLFHSVGQQDSDDSD